jgi:hypothetical protein
VILLALVVLGIKESDTTGLYRKSVDEVAADRISTYLPSA